MGKAHRTRLPSSMAEAQWEQTGTQEMRTGTHPGLIGLPEGTWLPTKCGAEVTA